MIKYSIPKGYRNQKTRNVFAISNFRGIDKENKPLKVQPFRATDGKNFIIDSNTLKTRPSFEMDTEPSFYLEDGEFLIDWHQFANTKIYVTNFHFYFERNGVAVNEQSQQLVKGGIAPNFDFSGKKPHFQEEKECLFIFCLDGIYVYSEIYENTTLSSQVFYELRTKPNNPYNSTQIELFEAFVDLPTPYEPTIFIDDKPADDVNVLSNVSKYQIFASSLETRNAETVYNLITTYDQKKHGTFDVNENIEVTFYKNRYGTVPTVVPSFMGILNDNFDDLADYGTSFLALGEGGTVPTFTEIRDTFFSSGFFRYEGTTEEISAVVSEQYGLTRDNFFGMIVQNTEGLTVFEFLMDYIKENGSIFSAMSTNKYIKFLLNVRYTADFYDGTTDVLKQRAVQEKKVPVYIQFKKFDEGLDSLEEERTSLNTSTVTDSSNLIYPNYLRPIGYGTATIDHQLYINELEDASVPSIVDGGLSEQGVLETFLNRAEARLKLEDTSEWENGDIVSIKGQFYQSIPSVLFYRDITLGSIDFRLLRNQVSVTYPSYPSTMTLPEATFDIGDVGTGTSISFDSNTVERSALLNTTTQYIISEEIVGTGTLYFRAQLYKTINISDGEEIVTLYTTARAGFFANYTVTTQEITGEKRYSIQLIGESYAEGAVPIERIAFRLKLKPEDGLIQLIVKDYFFDFNNEPTIDVKVTFNQNTDYEIIANSRFGITFGSENRLFLAGNLSFPNIDRFNVSNDLLGDGEKNQSYELTYFPSRNYRVLGGKGAINGYVIATDTELYVTKEDYPNDDRLFIRQRSLGTQGFVNYNEYKTNIKKSPLNERCLVRFYNDILVLAKDGLYGIEISSNVLTNERLVKLRSGFINEELKAKIAAANRLEIFIVENNRMMYIVIGKEMYVADSRYIAQNPNSEIENLSYEIVKWTSESEWKTGKIYEGDLYLVEKDNHIIYKLSNNNYDEYIQKEENLLSVDDLTGYEGTKVFFMSNAYNYVFENPSNYAFVVKSGYKVVGVNTVDFTVSGTTVTVLDAFDFAPFVDGDILYWKAANASTFYPFEVENFELSERTTFTFDQASGERVRIYEDISNKKLYITQYWIIDNVYYFRLSPNRPVSAEEIEKLAGETDEDFIIRIYGLINTNEDYYFTASGLQNALIQFIPYILTQWVSSITDFGNDLFEKTSFRLNIYATKQENTNNMTFGYRTLRRLAGLSSAIDLSNQFDFQEVDYSQFSLSTMDTVGFSLPMKENNFLYIQFTINGSGKIELNSIEVSYKLNRLLKTVG
jgi:hypothetical protein